MVNSLYKQGLLDPNFSDPHILFRGEFVGVQDPDRARMNNHRRFPNFSVD